MSTGNAEIEGHKLIDLAHKMPADASMAMSEELGSINHAHKGDMKYLQLVTETFNKYRDPLDHLPPLTIVGDNGKKGIAEIQDGGSNQVRGKEQTIAQNTVVSDSKPIQPSGPPETGRSDETAHLVKSIGSFLWHLLPFSASGCGTAPEVPPPSGAGGGGGAGGAGGCSDATGGGGAGGAGGAGGSDRKDCSSSHSSTSSSSSSTGGLPG